MGRNPTLGRRSEAGGQPARRHLLAERNVPIAISGLKYRGAIDLARHPESFRNRGKSAS